MIHRNNERNTAAKTPDTFSNLSHVIILKNEVGFNDDSVSFCAKFAMITTLNEWTMLLLLLLLYTNVIHIWQTPVYYKGRNQYNKNTPVENKVEMSMQH